MMPPFGPALGADGDKDVANYVRSLSGLAHDSLRAQRGKDCLPRTAWPVTVRKPRAPRPRRPNLTDKTWLYGSGEATIIETVTNGRSNQMPAFKEFLGEDKVHLLAAYVLSLSKNSAAPEEKVSLS
jgi:cytochrome c oxidase cbb3-type subunit 3